ncbi:hypothetical protein SAE02_39370 [Skermanella aerolata]|uniref:Uncharacterized protein n=1 Tax=Skermanella aerolata TaxID=393310 RepID=A0A512DTJ0_9PROT|nr:hypothetical protein N826_09540 [Skermanella aerolata KACC 11604]GEO39789.1 hypothetical protein SAE02_39370 [Skermanella aerolata]
MNYFSHGAVWLISTVGSKSLLYYGSQWQFKVETIELNEEVQKVRYWEVIKSVGMASVRYRDSDEKLDVCA